MRAIPLIVANLKGFIRNWKSVLLLVVFPILLIGVVFLSFNQQGFGRVPAGLVASEASDAAQFSEQVSSFLDVKSYGTLSACLDDLKASRIYLCVEPRESDVFVLNVYYDNTREPIIWQILESFKAAVDVMQQQKSEEMATEMLSRFRTVGDKISYFKGRLQEVSGLLDSYITSTYTAVDRLGRARTDLNDAVLSMESDIDDISAQESELRSQKNEFYNDATESLDTLEYSLNIIPYNPNISYSIYAAKSSCAYTRSAINSYNLKAEAKFREVDSRITKYRDTCAMGKTYLADIDSGIIEIKGTKADLEDYKKKIEDTDEELSSLRESAAEMESMNPETIVNPVVVSNTPVYIPSSRQALSGPQPVLFEDVVTAFNLISLQTIFPKILLLVVMFLSILISNFIALSEINLPANTRVSIIEGIHIHEFISTFFSSMVIVSLPVAIVLFLGNNLFQLHIMENLTSVLAVVILLSTIFVLFGILVAYAVKKESVSLVITTFLILFFIFFSGFILPIERMSPQSKQLADIFPGKISLDAFNKTVFYDLPISTIYDELDMLFGWMAATACAAYFIKRIRNE